MCVVCSMSRHVCLTVPAMRTSKSGCSLRLWWAWSSAYATRRWGLLEEEERDERTSARGTSGVVRELALLDGTTRREDVGVSWIKHRAGCWGVLLLDAEERGLDVLLVVAEQHVLDLRNQLGSRVGPCGECAAPGPAR